MVAGPSRLFTGRGGHLETVLSMKGGVILPTISMFYGIIVTMNFREHNPPHIHVTYQGQRASYGFDGEVTKGSRLPVKQHKLVVAWIALHQEELEADWALAQSSQAPYPIEPLR